MTMASRQATKTFIRPEGHVCHVSTGIHDLLTFGTGELSDNGFWEFPCGDCARDHEIQFPECGYCWPHTLEQLEEMDLQDDKTETD